MKPIPSMFTKYEFTSAELMDASKLTLMQEAKLQTQLATLVEEKLLLTYDTNNSLTYVQREAELQGQIRILQSLLNESQAAKQGY